MFSRIILSILIFITTSNNLFSMSKENRTTLSNIKKLELIDKDYRTLAVLPFENLTGNDYYSYIGKTIQKFLSNNLSIIDKIKISTNDYLIPDKFKTNKNIVYSYGTNLLRKVIILKSDTIYKKYIEFHKPEDLESFSQEIKADYIISGSYNFKKKVKNKFNVAYNIFNVIQKKQVYNNRKILDQGKIELGIKDISTEIIQYFYPQEIGFIKIVTDFSNYELFIDNQLIPNKINLYKLPAGKHKINLRILGYYHAKTNIILKQDKTNILSFSKKHLFINKASLVINSDPTNASVYLNIKRLGNTPLSYTNLLPGKCRLKVIKSNYSSHFQNIDLKSGTNQFFISLKKIYSKEYYEKKHERNKYIMYTTLGVGSLFLLNSYFFYATAGVEEDKANRYYFSGEYKLYKKHFKTYNNYMLITQISIIAGLGALVVSTIYFFKILNYDDANIGLGNKHFNTEFAYKNNNHFFTLKYRF